MVTQAPPIELRQPAQEHSANLSVRLKDVFAAMATGSGQVRFNPQAAPAQPVQSPPALMQPYTVFNEWLAKQPGINARKFADGRTIFESGHGANPDYAYTVIETYMGRDGPRFLNDPVKFMEDPKNAALKVAVIGYAKNDGSVTVETLRSAVTEARKAAQPVQSPPAPPKPIERPAPDQSQNMSAPQASTPQASAQPVREPARLQLPKIASTEELDKLLAQTVPTDPLVTNPGNWSLFRIRPLNDGKTVWTMPDSDGKPVNYALWLRKSDSGKFDQIVMVDVEKLRQLVEKPGGRLSPKDLIDAGLLAPQMHEISWLTPDNKPVALKTAAPNNIWTKLNDNGQRVMISDAEFAALDNSSKADPTHVWTAENYKPGDVVDPAKLLHEEDKPKILNVLEVENLASTLALRTESLRDAARNSVREKPSKQLDRADFDASDHIMIWDIRKPKTPVAEPVAAPVAPVVEAVTTPVVEQQPVAKIPPELALPLLRMDETLSENAKGLVRAENGAFKIAQDLYQGIVDKTLTDQQIGAGRTSLSAAPAGAKYVAYIDMVDARRLNGNPFDEGNLLRNEMNRIHGEALRKIGLDDLAKRPAAAPQKPPVPGINSEIFDSLSPSKLASMDNTFETANRALEYIKSTYHESEHVRYKLSEKQLETILTNFERDFPAIGKILRTANNEMKATTDRLDGPVKVYERTKAALGAAQKAVTPVVEEPAPAVVPNTPADVYAVLGIAPVPMSSGKNTVVTMADSKPKVLWKEKQEDGRDAYVLKTPGEAMLVMNDRLRNEMKTTGGLSNQISQAALLFTQFATQAAEESQFPDYNVKDTKNMPSAVKEALGIKAPERRDDNNMAMDRKDKPAMAAPGV
jgi:hypothetical protein